MEVELSGAHTRRVEHLLGGDGLRLIGIFVIEIDHLGDAALNDRLRALVAGEEVDIKTGALEGLSVSVENGVQLGVYDILLLGILALTLP